VIPSLEDKAMHEVALDAWKTEDPSQQALPDDFREQLRRIDEKERTLFAIMLALYRAKHPDTQGLTTDALLEYILKLEWRKRLEPAGYCSDNLHFLMLATIMRTYILSREENEKTAPKLKVEKLRDFGLGRNVHHGGGDIELMGAEPDILGEYLILRGNISTNVEPHVQVKDQIAQAWEANPSETASFFVRCVQNFNNEPTLSTYLLNPPETVGAQAAWVMAVSASIAYYSVKFDNPAEAEKLYDALCSVGGPDDFKKEKASAAAAVVAGYAFTGIFAIAEKWYGILSSLGNPDQFKRQKAVAAMALVVAHTRSDNYKDIAESEKWYETLDNFRDPVDFIREKATAASALVVAHAFSKKLSEAEKWYVILSSFVRNDAFQKKNAEAITALVWGYTMVKNFPEAEKRYNILSKLGCPDDFKEEKATAGYNLVRAYAETDKFVDAQRIYDTMLLLGDSQKVVEIRKEALAELRKKRISPS
jgi:hypothetical protein